MRGEVLLKTNSTSTVPVLKGRETTLRSCFISIKLHLITLAFPFINTDYQYSAGGMHNVVSAPAEH